MNDNNFETVLAQQLSNQELIAKLKINFGKKGKDKLTTSYIKGQLRLLNTYFDNFIQTHTNLVGAAAAIKTPLSEIAYFSADLFSDVEEVYSDLSSKMNDMLPEESDSSQHIAQVPYPVRNTSSNLNEVKLPVINLPKFSGCYTEWMSFRDIFISLIHSNITLNKVQKMHYLKSSLSGKAEGILGHLQIAEANYDEAWKIICERYHNPRIIVDSYLELLLSQTVLKVPSAEGIRKLQANFKLQSLKISVSSWDAIVIHLLVKNFDSDSRRIWEESLAKSDKYPTIEEFYTFLETRFRALEALSVSSSRQMRNTVKSPKSFVATTHSRCAACSQTHFLYQCSSFKNLPRENQNEIMKRNRICLNCLMPGHFSNSCKSKSRCQKCNGRHHTILHFKSTNENSTESPGVSYAENTSMPLVSACSTSSCPSFQTTLINPALLPTAMVKVITPKGEFPIRALVDQGSQVSFISENIVERFELRKQNFNLPIGGINSSRSASTGFVNVTLQSYIHQQFSLSCKLVILKTITTTLPEVNIPIDPLFLNSYKLADQEFNKTGPIDILLGADLYCKFLLNQIVKLENGFLLQNTEFGWIISGVSNESSMSPIVHSNVSYLPDNTDVNNLLRRFWEIEEGTERSCTPEERACEDYFVKTTTRDPSGRYVVSLPFRESSLCNSIPNFGDSLSNALARLSQLEKTFLKRPELRSEYGKFMKEYEILGHMEFVSYLSNLKTSERIYFLPHHAVLKESSSTTKLRVVFDGACKTSNGVSINDCLYAGPALQNDLFSILLRWRTHNICFSSDIEKMFRQISVCQSDTKYQNILWRNSSDEQIRVFKLKTVTYGTTCAPYLSIRVLRQLAEDERSTFKIASNILYHDTYVDDIISGCDSIEEAIVLQKELSELLLAGGFHLRKWSSNSTELLRHIPTNDQEQTEELRFDEDATIKALGLFWSPATDHFRFRLTLSVNCGRPTKRILLSDIAKLFDPLGWLSPVVVVAKLMLQKTWLAGISWDDHLPAHLENDWVHFRTNLCRMEEIRIPRWVNTFRSDSLCTIELHGYCDSSTVAYAAVIYCRVVFPDGNTKVSLLAAKTKVAPLKQVSLPRLELCGAVLLAKLIFKIKKTLNLPIAKTYAWCDSTIVLSWIRGAPNRWKVFVANRVSEIQTYTNIENWRHVPSLQNPADSASRGISPECLSSLKLWWNGPDWLKSPISDWPSQANAALETTLEARPITCLQTNVTHNPLFLYLISRYSCFKRLTHVTAYCFRYIHILHSKKRNSEVLTLQEKLNARNWLVKQSQQLSFPEEIKYLEAGKEFKLPSNISSLAPFLDEDGILRVGGRLRLAKNLPFDSKHQILLSNKCSLTLLLIAEAHERTLHGGPSMMIAYLRQTYWILNVRNLARKHLHNCIRCIRFNTKLSSQIMGSLPSPRITPSKPFRHSGVDFAGPIDLRTAKGRTAKTFKGYICVFICLCTKAIHLEPVSELTSEAFLAALRRFVSRRGVCSDLYSDCGTNFVGANRLLKESLLRYIADNPEDIQSMVSRDGIQWHFNPPSSPHFGGLWEAGVKSTKYHLKRILNNQVLTFEELYTLLSQIESCLNSRPLCAMSDNPNDFDVLTPAHFLIGEPTNTLPEPSMLDAKISPLHRWRLVQQLHQHFWKRWSSEYLGRLQQRPKWTTAKKNVEVGDLVIVKDERYPSSKWPLGRIIETHPGSDGYVRVVTVKMQNSIIKRPIVKLCMLPQQKSFNS